MDVVQQFDLTAVHCAQALNNLGAEFG